MIEQRDGVQRADIDDVITIHLIATGILKIAESEQGGDLVAAAPYPEQIQRGFDRLIVSCMLRGVPPPASIPAMLTWCRKPFAQWPVRLTDESIGPNDALLTGSIPTRVCQEWAVDSIDPEAHLLEQRLLRDVLTLCRASDRQDSYVAFRSLLIERPVMTAFELQRERASAMLTPLAEQLRDAYRPAPMESVDGHHLICCTACGNLLVRMRDKSMRCVEERCPSFGKTHIGRKLATEDDVYWLRRDLRAFIAAPGQTEVRLAARLRDRGLSIEMWPAFDAYDIRATFPDGAVWAVDVKDWMNAVLLARQVRPIPALPSWDRAFWVFPQERIRRQRDYVRAFKVHCPHVRGHHPSIEARVEKDFLKSVDQRLGGRDA